MIIKRNLFNIYPTPVVSRVDEFIFEQIYTTKWFSELGGPSNTFTNLWQKILSHNQELCWIKLGTNGYICNVFCCNFQLYGRVGRDREMEWESSA